MVTLILWLILAAWGLAIACFAYRFWAAGRLARNFAERWITDVDQFRLNDQDTP